MLVSGSLRAAYSGRSLGRVSTAAMLRCSNGQLLVVIKTSHEASFGRRLVAARPMAPCTARAHVSGGGVVHRAHGSGRLRTGVKAYSASRGGGKGGKDVRLMSRGQQTYAWQSSMQRASLSGLHTMCVEVDRGEGHNIHAHFTT